jgi:DNA primase
MMAQAGFRNTVATLGTACTQEHLSQISQYADKVYVTYDADKAGQNAVIKMVELCWNANLDLYVIKLPQGHDPASFLQEKKDFNVLINQSLDIFDFILENYGKDFQKCSFSEKLKLTKKVVELISKIKDNIKRHILLKRASELFGIPIDMLKNEITALDLHITPEPKKHESLAHENAEASLCAKTQIKHSNEITLLEKNLFSVIIYNKGELDLEEEKFLIQFFGSPFKELLTKIHTLKNSEVSDTVSHFSGLTEEERNLVSSLVIGANDDKNTLNELLAQFYKKQWKLIVTKMKLKISQAQKMGDVDLVKSLLGRLETLRNKILKRGGANG